MKKFRFALQPLLGHRERLEDRQQQILAARRNELIAAQNELMRLNDEFKRYSVLLREGHKDFTSEQLRWHYAHLEYLDRRITMQHAQVAQRRAAVERGRADLMQASKDRRVIEQLKDKRFQEHRLLQAAIEQKEFDDANNRRPMPAITSR